MPIIFELLGDWVLEESGDCVLEASGESFLKALGDYVREEGRFQEAGCELAISFEKIYTKLSHTVNIGFNIISISSKGTLPIPYCGVQFLRSIPYIVIV